MTLINDDEKIEALDLCAIKTKLMHKSGECWSQERADTAEREYRRFLYLVKKFPNQQTAPTVDVDMFWHNHILDTKKYASDCQQIFGFFLHHYPYLGIGGADSQAARQHGAELMRKLYEETFGESYYGNTSDQGGNARGAATAYCTLGTKTAYCTLTTKSAYCTFATKTAYCTFATKTAYCTVPAEFADRSLNTQPAYCTIVGEPAYRSLAARRAYCTIAADRADFAAMNDAGEGRKEAVRTCRTARRR